MCIAILNTKKAGRLPKSQIMHSWDNNDMGAGLLWNEKNKLRVFKTYEYDEYLSKYNELRDNQEIGNIVLHFRIATSGYKGEHNLHPFLVNENLGFVHNGVISGLGNKTFSDTYEFNDMLKKFTHNFLSCDMTKYFISEYIGYSKLIFLDVDDKYTIINEEKGKWTDGNWYSNDSYKEYKSFVYHGNTKVAKGTAYTPSYKTYNYAGVYRDATAFDSPADDLNDFDDDLDEWEVYEYVCEIYGLDMEDEGTFEQIETYMEVNGVNTVHELYAAITR